MAEISGVLAIYCVVQWCWFLDRPLAQTHADIGAGIMVPTYVTGPGSTGWWAMIITLVVAGMVLAMNAFSYVFLWSRNPQLWAPPPQLLSLGLVISAYVAAGLLAWGAARVLRRDRPPAAAGMMLLAAVLACAGWGADLQAWLATALRPEANAQGAMVFAFLAWQGFFAAIVAIMGAYAVARWLAGKIGARRTATFDLIALFIVYTACQGLVSTLLTRLFPGG